MPPLREDSAEDLALELVERLSSTVARSIAPFPKVAIMAGGGLDSAGLLAITMKQRRDSEIFAIDYAEFNNDRPHLRTLAKHFKLVPKVIRAADTASLLPAGLVVDGAPFGWPTAQFEVALGLKARQAGAEAIITGMGGDDVFDGDLGIFGRGEGVVGRGKSLWDAARLRVTWSSTPFSRIRGLVLKPWFESLAPPPVREAWRRSRVRPWVWAGPKLREILELPAGRTSLGWFADLAVFGALADAADYRGQFELAAGLTRLDPYLDANIVEFVASIPPNMMFHDRRIRGFFRLAMKGHLPDTVRLRPDKAWLDPAFVELYSMIRNNDEIAELSRMEALADLGLVNPAGVRKALADAEAQQDVPAWLSVLLGEEAFVREHSRLKLFDAERGRVEVARA
jgi:asparagine synthetase B (glutamine-hydrolysing)